MREAIVMLDFGTKNEVVLVSNKQNISSERGVCVCKITWLQPRIHTKEKKSNPIPWI